MTTKVRSTGFALLVGVVVPLVVGFGPPEVVLGARRLLVFALVATAASTTVGRLRLPDLSVAAAVGIGATMGGVGAGLGWWPLAVGVAAGAAAAVPLGAGTAALAVRVGRQTGALVSLAVGLGVLAVLRATTATGGASGFHAVPLLTGSDRGDALALVAALLVAIAVTWSWMRSRVAAIARTGLDAPEVARAMGYAPAAWVASGGALSAALLGASGALAAAVSGSVVPDGYGLGFTAAIVLAVLAGGSGPFAGVIGAAIVWGPSTLFPLVPWVGDDPLLVAGPLALAVVLLRRAAERRAGAPGVAWPAAEPHAPTASHPTGLPTTTVGLLGGRSVEVQADAGQIVAITGPNGAGKSTLLASLGGQRGRGRSVRARAKDGVARTWQRDPEVDLVDAAVAAEVGGDTGAAAWAVQLLGAHAVTAAGQQLVRLVARRPSVALLDEPAANLPADAVGHIVRGLAAGGCAVVVVEHRPELTALADRRIDLGVVAGGAATEGAP